MLELLAQTTQPVQPAWGTNLFEAVVGLVTVVITYFLVPWLKAQRRRALEQANDANVSAKTRLKAMVVATIEAAVIRIAQREWPKLAQRIAAGELNSVAAIRAQLYGWAASVRSEVITIFMKQGIDLVQDVGDEFIDLQISVLAERYSPVPNRPTAEVLLRDKELVSRILQKGTDWINP